MDNISPSPGNNPLARLERIPVWPYGPALLVVLGLGYLFSFFDITNIGYAIPVIVKQMHASTNLVSEAVTTSLIGYIAGSLVVSVLSDALGRRLALMIGILLYTIGSLATAFSPSVGWLIAWRFVVGMGIGTMISQVSTYLGEISPAPLRGKFSGLANLFSFLGLAIVPFVAYGLVPHFTWGWRALLFVGALGGVAMLFIGRDLIESPRWLIIHGRKAEAIALIDRIEVLALKRMKGAALPPVVNIPTEEDAHGFPVAALLKPPYLSRVIVLLAYWLLFYIGDYAYLGLAPTILVRQGFNLANSIGFSALSGLGFLAGAVFIYFFADRIERKFTLIAMGIIGGIAIILAGLFPSPTSIVIAGFLFTSEIAMLSILGYVITAEHFPTRARSSGLALGDGIGHLGGALAPAITLFAVAHWKITGGYGLMGIATFASLIFMAMTSRATRKNLESVNDSLYDTAVLDEP